MGETIRIAGSEDAATVAEMIAGLLGELAPGEAPDLAALEATASRVLGLGTVTALLAEEEGAATGLLMLNECAAIYAGGAFGEITELYVRPDLRSRGIAGRLVAEAERIGRARGWRRIEVGAPSQPDWARTLAFYRRAGFIEIGPRLKRAL